MANEKLKKAKKAKNDEFYTQYADIQAEMNAYLEYNKDVFRDKTVLLPCDDPEWSNFTRYFAEHFEKFGLKKLISTSYALETKKQKYGIDYQITIDDLLTEENVEKEKLHGKIFVLDRDTDNSGRIDINDLQWNYLEGDGDFRSDEVKKLRDEADIIVTNPPFSLFREFVAWIMEADKKFIIIGNKNSTTCKEIFPYIQENKIWLGPSITSGGRNFRVPDNYNESKKFIFDEEGNKYVNIPGPRWFTNIDHGRRHQPLALMTMADNIKFSKHKEIKSVGYLKYDNYDAIEVPFSDAIPLDYDGVMGVPVTFLDKYCPEQFDILGCTQRGCHEAVPDTKKYDNYKEMKQDGKPTGSSGSKTNENANIARNDGKNNYFINEEGHIVQSAYSRVFIRKRREEQ